MMTQPDTAISAGLADTTIHYPKIYRTWLVLCIYHNGQCKIISYTLMKVWAGWMWFRGGGGGGGGEPGIFDNTTACASLLAHKSARTLFTFFWTISVGPTQTPIYKVAM